LNNRHNFQVLRVHDDDQQDDGGSRRRPSRDDPDGLLGEERANFFRDPVKRDIHAYSHLPGPSPLAARESWDGTPSVVPSEQPEHSVHGTGREEAYQSPAVTGREQVDTAAGEPGQEQAYPSAEVTGRELRVPSPSVDKVSESQSAPKALVILRKSINLECKEYEDNPRRKGHLCSSYNDIK
jgi:hypothetical protein